MKYIRLISTCLLCLPLNGLAQEHEYPLRPVEAHNVRVTGGFWFDRLQTNRQSTLLSCFREMEGNGTIRNFEIAGGRSDGSQSGVYPFLDTDLYKSVEAASYLLLAAPDPWLERMVDSMVALVGAAQEPDGYLYTARTNKATRLSNWAGPERWSKLERSHELYNAGHLFEAAAAHFLGTGKRTLLEVALRKADLIISLFGPEGKRIPPGHQEIEIGLVKLYRVTGNKRYLDLAKFFLEERGHARGGRTLYGEYAQDHKPIFEQEEVVGHAVRVPYMGIAMADIAALTGDRRYVAALDRLWRNMVEKKMYLIGGLGATGFGERFEGNYDLPNFSAYNETCTSVANALWNHRLFLLHADGKYLDVFERALYNGLLAGISLSGDRFFYPNPLASRGYHVRSSWFDCACCPPNLARFLGQFPSFAYAAKGDSLYLNLFLQSEAEIGLSKTKVKIEQKTNYPWSGDVAITMDPAGEHEFSFFVRIPGWARNQPVPGDLYSYVDAAPPVRVFVNGKQIHVSVHKGFVEIRRIWKKNDRIELSLPMPVKRTLAHPNVEANRGRVALERGPLVYCLEGIDQADERALHLSLPDTTILTDESRIDMLGSIVVVRGSGWSSRYSHHPTELLIRKQDITAIPYYAWANRGASEMVVWIPTDPTRAEPMFSGSRFSESVVSSSAGTGNIAGLLNSSPSESEGPSLGSLLWDADQDTAWLQIDFTQPQEISSVEVFWKSGKEIRPPASWRVLALVKEKWEAVYNPEKHWGSSLNTWNASVFETARTKVLRVVAVPYSGSKSGIIGLRVH